MKKIQKCHTLDCNFPSAIFYGGTLQNKVFRYTIILVSVKKECCDTLHSGSKGGIYIDFTLFDRVYKYILICRFSTSKIYALGLQ